jgi:hypothetical protein
VGALADPTVEIRDVNGVTIGSNDDWKSFNSRNRSDRPRSRRRFPNLPSLCTLPPGNYTAIVAGKDGSSGVALIEVYGCSQVSAAEDRHRTSRRETLSTRGGWRADIRHLVRNPLLPQCCPFSGRDSDARERGPCRSQVPNAYPWSIRRIPSVLRQGATQQRKTKFCRIHLDPGGRAANVHGKLSGLFSPDGGSRFLPNPLHPAHHE